MNKFKGCTIVGLTGGAGSGKSAVAEVFLSQKIPVINADELAREITLPGTPAINEILQEFGKNALLLDGSLNREWLRNQIISDSNKQKILESITHPKIKALAKKKKKDLFELKENLIVYEAPLLIEANSQNDVNCIICVIAEDETRAQRISKRDGTSLTNARKLIKSQMDQNEKIKFATYIIQNNGTISELKLKTLELINKLKQL